jgi:PadR family transcriptional regulator PadR
MGLLVDTKATLLQVLIEGEGYGLQLIARVSERTNGTMRLLEGRVYPALRELEAEGLVTSYEAGPLPERGGRPRRYYKLTAEGKRAAKTQAKAIRRLLTPATSPFGGSI